MNIQQSSLEFLTELSKHNNRDWFAKNKDQFTLAHENVTAFMEALQSKLNETDIIEGRKLFRIYRDVRFSKDKTPFKTRFSGYFKRSGEDRRGGYYMRIGPGETVIGGGFYGPNKEDLMRIRKEFEFDGKTISSIVADSNFKSLFGEIKGDGVKTAPKGFDKEHDNIHYIKKKQWFVERRFTDKEVLSSNFVDEAARTYAGLRPFFNYFTDVLTTDLNGESLLK